MSPRRYPGDWHDPVNSTPQVPWGLVELHHISGSQVPRYPGDWWGSVYSTPQVPFGLAELSPGTLGTCGTQSFQPRGYPANWWDLVFLAPYLRRGLATVHPGDWRDSSSARQVPRRRDPPKRTGTCESLTESRRLVLVLLTTFAIHEIL